MPSDRLLGHVLGISRGLRGAGGIEHNDRQHDERCEDEPREIPVVIDGDHSANFAEHVARYCSRFTP